jgi:hypothetical protein
MNNSHRTTFRLGTAIHDGPLAEVIADIKAAVSRAAVLEVDELYLLLRIAVPHDVSLLQVIMTQHDWRVQFEKKRLESF